MVQQRFTIAIILLVGSMALVGWIAFYKSELLAETLRLCNAPICLVLGYFFGTRRSEKKVLSRRLNEDDSSDRLDGPDRTNTGELEKQVLGTRLELIRELNRARQSHRRMWEESSRTSTLSSLVVVLFAIGLLYFIVWTNSPGFTLTEEATSSILDILNRAIDGLVTIVAAIFGVRIGSSQAHSE